MNIKTYLALYQLFVEIHPKIRYTELSLIDWGFTRGLLTQQEFDDAWKRYFQHV